MSDLLARRRRPTRRPARRPARARAIRLARAAAFDDAHELGRRPRSRAVIIARSSALDDGFGVVRAHAAVDSTDEEVPPLARVEVDARRRARAVDALDEFERSKRSLALDGGAKGERGADAGVARAREREHRCEHCGRRGANRRLGIERSLKNAYHDT